MTRKQTFRFSPILRVFFVILITLCLCIIVSIKVFSIRIHGAGDFQGINVLGPAVALAQCGNGCQEPNAIDAVNLRQNGAIRVSGNLVEGGEVQLTVPVKNFGNSTSARFHVYTEGYTARGDLWRADGAQPTAVTLGPGAMTEITVRHALWNGHTGIWNTSGGVHIWNDDTGGWAGALNSNGYNQNVQFTVQVAPVVDLRQNGEIQVSGNLAEDGEVQLTIPVKNFGNANSARFHVYTEGYTASGALWRADGAQPTAVTLGPGATTEITVRHALWSGHAGTWNTSAGVHIWNDDVGAWAGALNSNGYNQNVQFTVQVAPVVDLRQNGEIQVLGNLVEGGEVQLTIPVKNFGNANSAHFHVYAEGYTALGDLWRADGAQPTAVTLGAGGTTEITVRHALWSGHAGTWNTSAGIHIWNDDAGTWGGALNANSYNQNVQFDVETATTLPDLRQNGEIQVSGNLVEGGEVQLTVPVKNFGNSTSARFHVYTEGYTARGDLWRADGAQPTAVTLGPGQTVEITVRHELWGGHAGTWNTSAGVHIWNDDAGAWAGALNANSYNQNIQFAVETAASIPDLRQNGEIQVSGNLVEGGEVQLTIPVKNFGNAISPRFHVYTEGYSQQGSLWRADGAQPTAVTLAPGQSVQITVRHELWSDHVGIWNTSAGVHVWNDDTGAWTGALNANGYNQNVQFSVQSTSSVADLRQNGKILVSGSLVEGGEVQLTIPVKNFGNANSLRFHLYTEGNTAQGDLWRADGAQPTAIILAAGESSEITVRHALWMGHNGLWHTFGVYIWDDTLGNYSSPLAANGFNQSVEFNVEQIASCPNYDVNNVVLFEHVNCSGPPLSFNSDLGLFDLDAYGWDNRASSVYIPAGLSLKVYEQNDGNGASRCLTGPMGDFSIDNYDNSTLKLEGTISSAQVFANGDCTAPPPNEGNCSDLEIVADGICLSQSFNKRIAIIDLSNPNVRLDLAYERNDPSEAEDPKFKIKSITEHAKGLLGNFSNDLIKKYFVAVNGTGFHPPECEEDGPCTGSYDSILGINGTAYGEDCAGGKTCIGEGICHSDSSHFGCGISSFMGFGPIGDRATIYRAVAVSPQGDEEFEQGDYEFIFDRISESNPGFAVGYRCMILDTIHQNGPSYFPEYVACDKDALEMLGKTLLGVSKDGTKVFLAVTILPLSMTTSRLAREMLDLGAARVIMLDSGGSSPQFEGHGRNGNVGFPLYISPRKVINAIVAYNVTEDPRRVARIAPTGGTFLLDQSASLQVEENTFNYIAEFAYAPQYSEGLFSNGLALSSSLQENNRDAALKNVQVFFRTEVNDLNRNPLTPTQPLILTIGYAEEDLPIGVLESQLHLYYWNGDSWQKDETSTVDTVNNVVSTSTTFIGSWAILAENHITYLPMAIR